MHPYRRLLPYARRQWRSMLLIAALSLLTPLITALSPWPIKILVDSATENRPSGPVIARLVDWLPITNHRVALLLIAGLASLGLYLLGSAMESVLSFTWTAAGQRMVYDLSADLFGTLQRLSLRFHTRRPVGDSLSRLTGDCWCIYSIFEGLLVTPAQQILTIVIVGLFAWRLDPVLMLLSLTIAPLLAVSVVFFGPRIQQRAKLRRNIESQLTSFVHQTLSSIPLVQVFSTQARNLSRYRQITSGAVTLTQKAAVLKNAYNVFVGLVAAIGAAAVICVGAHRVLSGALTIGGLLVFLAYFRTLQASTQQILQLHGTLKDVGASVDRVLEVLDETDRVTERHGAVPLCASASPAPAIRLNKVTFGYEPDRPVLSDLSLELSSGSTVALVGATGAGKSTLACLIPRLLDPWTGTVELNGQDVRGLTIQSVREQFAFVMQEPLILPLSIRQNITYGRPDASDREIRVAAEAAGADEFIERMECKYEAIVGERGATLSAGQRQRLAIARAILTNAPILILDEPTSNLDAATEHSVMGAIRGLIAGRTALIIAHRLSTVRIADRIVVLDRGRIVEQGTHQQLLLKRGLYFDLWQASRRAMAHQEES